MRENLPKRLHPFWDAAPITLLTACLLGEAEGESRQGMLGVACVIRNRVFQPTWWGDTYHEVILMRHQFSCFYTDFKLRERIMLTALRAAPTFHRAYSVAEDVLVMGVPDITGGATHYFNRRVVTPSWAKHLHRTARIGRHDFYGDL